VKLVKDSMLSPAEYRAQFCDKNCAQERFCSEAYCWSTTIPANSGKDYSVNGRFSGI